MCTCRGGLKHHRFPAIRRKPQRGFERVPDELGPVSLVMSVYKKSEYTHTGHLQLPAHSFPSRQLLSPHFG